MKDFSVVRKLLVLGAGFSAPAGIPTMRQFFPKAWHFLTHREGLGGHTRDFPAFHAVENVWLEWQPRRTEDRFDLEAFAIYVAEKMPGLRQDLVYVIVRTFDLCKERLVGSTCASIWTNLYLAFAEELIRHRDQVAVLSFNYDLLLDQALLRRGCAPHYHLPPEDVVDLNEQHKPTQGCNLFKPHGSFNWFTCENQRCRKITVDWSAGPDNENRPGNWQTGRALNADKHEHGIHLYPIIIPPEDKDDHKKMPKWPRELLAPVRQQITEILPNVEKVLFVGWSAPDTDKTWRKVFKENLNKGLRQAWVVDAEKDPEKQERLKAHYQKFIQVDDDSFHLGSEGEVCDFAGAKWWRKFLS